MERDKNNSEKLKRREKDDNNINGENFLSMENFARTN